MSVFDIPDFSPPAAPGMLDLVGALSIGASLGPTHVTPEGLLISDKTSWVEGSMLLGTEDANALLQARYGGGMSGTSNVLGDILLLALGALTGWGLATSVSWYWTVATMVAIEVIEPSIPKTGVGADIRTFLHAFQAGGMSQVLGVQLPEYVAAAGVTGETIAVIIKVLPYVPYGILPNPLGSLAADALTAVSSPTVTTMTAVSLVLAAIWWAFEDEFEDTISGVLS